MGERQTSSGSLKGYVLSHQYFQVADSIQGSRLKSRNFHWQMIMMAPLF